MPTLTICNPKGGSGKTTLATNLAAEWHARGLDVLLVDLNEHQRSSLVWYELAQENGKAGPMVVSGGDAIHSQLKDFEQKYDLVIVDTPAEVNRRTIRALSQSDLAVVPIKASELDIVASGGVVDVLDAARDVNPNLDALIVMNAVDGRLRLSKSARESLAGLGVDISQTKIPASALLGQAWAKGLGIPKYRSGSPVAQQIKNLVDELEDRLGFEEEKSNVA